mgnify:CR=1 FL=1
MNNIPKPWQIEYYKKAYPPGTRIELTSPMAGEDIPAGAKATVLAVDDIGTIHCCFDNGRDLGVIPGEDSLAKIADTPETTQNQIKHKKKDRGRDR